VSVIKVLVAFHSKLIILSSWSVSKATINYLFVDIKLKIDIVVYVLFMIIIFLISLGAYFWLLLFCLGNAGLHLSIVYIYCYDTIVSLAYFLINCASAF